MSIDLNKHANFINYYFKKSRRFLSIVVVFLLLSTVASSVVSSGSIGSLISNTSEKSSIRLLQGKNLKEILKEKIQGIKDKINNLFDKLSSKIPKEQTPSDNIETIKNTRTTSFSKYLKVLSSMKNSDNSFAFYTNCNGFIKESKLKLYKETKIDVNSDSKNDISVKLTILPGIVKPLSLSINFKLIITRLADFPDKNAFFEAYAEFYFPGYIIPQQKGDWIRFGYLSEDGEEVPDSCTVTYKLIPYLFSKKKPETRLLIDPKSSAGKDKLTLIYSTTATYLPNVTEKLFEITYEPVVKSEVYLGSSDDVEKSRLKIESSDETEVSIYLTLLKEDGNSSGCGAYINRLPKNVEFEYEIKIKPLSDGTNFEYNQVSTTNLDVMFFVKNGLVMQLLNTKGYFYIKYLPRHFSFSSKLLGLNGHISLDTFDESVDEIGWCDDLFEPKNRFYFANLPTEGELSWNLRILREGSIDIFVDTIGVSANLFLTSEKGSIGIGLMPTNNINCSLRWNLSAGFFSFDRNSQELGFKIDLYKKYYYKILVSGALGLITDEKPVLINFGNLYNGYIGDGIEIDSGISLRFSQIYLFTDSYDEKFKNEDLARSGGRPITKFELDLQDVMINVGDNYIGGTVKFQPVFPALLMDLAEYFLNDEMLDNPFLESSYVRISLSGDCSINVGSCNLDIIAEDKGLPEINITSPKPKQIVRGVITISGNTTSGGFGTRPIEWVEVKIIPVGYLDADPSKYNVWLRATGTSSWSYSWNTTDLPDITCKILARCFDGVYYRETELTSGVIIDNFANPSINVTSIDGKTPHGEMQVDGEVLIEGTFKPGAFALNYYTVNISGYDYALNVKQNVTDVNWNYTWDTNDIPKGNYKIKIVLYDVERQRSIYNISVVVYNGESGNRPTVTITYPAQIILPLSIVSGVVTIEGSAAPGYASRPVELVQIKLIPFIEEKIIAGFFNTTDSYPWINVTGTSDWSYEWDTTHIPFGLYTILVRSYDGKFYSIPFNKGVIVKNIDFVNDSIKIDIYRSGQSSINISNVNINYQKLEQGQTLFKLNVTLDNIHVYRSDKSSILSIIINKKDQSFEINRTRSGCNIELNELLVDAQKYSDLNNDKILEYISIKLRINKIILRNDGQDNGYLKVQIKNSGSMTPGSGDFTVKGCLNLADGFEIYGIYFKIGGFYGDFNFGDYNIHVVGPKYMEFGLDVNYKDVTWEIAQDKSWGWIKIGGKGHAFADVDVVEYRAGELLFALAGVFYLENGDDVFEISWHEINEDQTQFIINGNASLAISDVHLTLGTILDFSIPVLTTKFLINFDRTTTIAENGTKVIKSYGELLLYIEHIEAGVESSGDIDIHNINIQNLLGLTLQFNLEFGLDWDAELYGSGTGILHYVWNESGPIKIEYYAESEDGVRLDLVADAYFKLKNLFAAGKKSSIYANQILLYGRGHLSITADGGIKGNLTALSANATVGGGAYVGLGLILNDVSLSGKKSTISAESFSISGAVDGSGVLEFTYNDTLEINFNGGADDAYLTIEATSVSFSGTNLSFVLGSASLTIGGSGHIKINEKGLDIYGGVGLSGYLSGLVVNGKNGSFWIGSMSGKIYAFGTADFSLKQLDSLFVSGEGYFIAENIGLSGNFSLKGTNVSLYANIGSISIAGEGSLTFWDSITGYIIVKNLGLEDAIINIKGPNNDISISGSINAGGGCVLSIYTSSNGLMFDVSGGGGVTLDCTIEVKNKFRVTLNSVTCAGSFTIEASIGSKYLRYQGDTYHGGDLYFTFIPSQITLGISGERNCHLNGDFKISWTGQYPKITSVRWQSTGGITIDKSRMITINGYRVLYWERDIEIDRNSDLYLDQVTYNAQDKLVGIHFSLAWSRSRSSDCSITFLQLCRITSRGTQLTGDFGLDWSNSDQSAKQVKIYSNTGLSLSKSHLVINIFDTQRSWSLDLISLNPGDLTIKWGYALDANSVYLQTNSGFYGYIGSLIVNGQPIFEFIDVSMSPGSDVELIYWSEPHADQQIPSLSKRIDFNFNGLSTLNMIKISSTTFVSGNINGNNAKITIGPSNSDPNCLYVIRSSSGQSSADISINIPGINISGSISWNGDIYSYWDGTWNEQSGTGKAIYFKSNNGFQGSGQLNIGNWHLSGSRTLGSGSALMAFDFTGGTNDIKQFYFDTEPNTFIQQIGFEFWYGNSAIKISPSVNNLWADGFWVHWDFIRLIPYWDWSGKGTIGCDNIDLFKIEATENGGSTWDQIYPLGTPRVSTTSASFTSNSATLYGNLDSIGLALCKVWFEYGTVSSNGDYGPSTSTTQQSQLLPGQFYASISSLSPSTTYYFRACASNGYGTTYGLNKTFTTAQAVNQPPEVYLHVYLYGPLDFHLKYSTSNDPYIECPGTINTQYTFSAYKHHSYNPGGDTNDPDGTIQGYGWELPGSCFLAGTKITMADGTYKNIEEIQIGDLVKTYDENKGIVTINKVTQTHYHEPDEMSGCYLIINNLLRVTPNHPIYVNNNWKKAEQIKIGDNLSSIDGKQITVISIEIIYEQVPTYNLEIENYHTYYAEDILVHNGDQDAEVWQDQDSDNNLDKNWAWVYGSIIPDITKSWSTPGTYDVILHVRDNDGAVSEATLRMIITSGGSSSDSVDSSVSSSIWEILIAGIS